MSPIIIAFVTGYSLGILNMLGAYYLGRNGWK